MPGLKEHVHFPERKTNQFLQLLTTLELKVPE